VATVITSPLGRAAAGIADYVRREILEGRWASGQFLPSVRELAGIHSVNTKTIWRALQAVASEGLIAAAPRKGYRVLPRANDPGRGCPLALVAAERRGPEYWAELGLRLLDCIREAGEQRGWSLLAVGAVERSAGEVIQQLQSARAFGAILEGADPAIIAAARQAGIPAVIINDWSENPSLDAVVQDGQMGSILAARHLMTVGCRRIAWFGFLADSPLGQDRLSGALTELMAAGRPLAPELVVHARLQDYRQRARELLARPERPDGIIALWRGYALAVKEAADELGLRLGRDLELVGWCPEEIIESAYLPDFAGGPVPPTITWSLRTMAETAAALLEERRRKAAREPLRIKVPTRLRVAK
jgi:DNA-binding LacI/PurR family transcriptional regulator